MPKAAPTIPRADTTGDSAVIACVHLESLAMVLKSLTVLVTSCTALV